ncbi:ABC transporter substrate-binding protein [Siccirubricoccus deserti]
MGDPFFLVGRAPRPDFGLADLAPLTLGSVSEVPTPWWTLQHDIRLAGLDPTTIRRVTDRGMAENAAAVAAGTLDVAQLFEPFVTLAEDAGTGHVWHAAASRGPTGYTTFTTTAELLQTKREPFKAMIRGIARTLAWVKAIRPRRWRSASPAISPTCRSRCWRAAWHDTRRSASGPPTPSIRRRPSPGWRLRCSPPAPSPASRASPRRRTMASSPRRWGDGWQGGRSPAPWRWRPWPAACSAAGAACALRQEAMLPAGEAARPHILGIGLRRL